jgi:hypothetical protein
MVYRSHGASFVRGSKQKADSREPAATFPVAEPAAALRFLANNRFWPILLKNSFFSVDENINGA